MDKSSTGKGTANENCSAGTGFDAKGSLLIAKTVCTGERLCGLSHRFFLQPTAPLATYLSDIAYVPGRDLGRRSGAIGANPAGSGFSRGNWVGIRALGPGGFGGLLEARGPAPSLYFLHGKVCRNSSSVLIAWKWPSGPQYSGSSVKNLPAIGSGKSSSGL